jgi:methyl-accepting chemotaxis protein
MASLPGIIIKIGANTRDAIQGINRVDRALGKTATTSRRMNAAMKAVGQGLAVGAAAAGAFAVKLGVDAVQAAIEEDQQLSTLHRTIKNLGFEDATDELDAFIDATARSSTATDSDLRPALAQLLTVTRDITTAEGLLTTSLDLAASANIPLAQATKAVAKATDGQFSALKKLVPGLDTLKEKTPDVTAVFGELNRVVGGSAKTSFNTLAGQLGQITDDFSELQESFGHGFLDALGESDAKAGDLSTTLQDMQPTVEALGATVGETVVAIGDISGAITSAQDAFTGFKDDIGPFADVLESITGAFYNMATPLLSISAAIKEIQNQASVGSNVVHRDPLEVLAANPVIPDPSRSRSNSQVLTGRSNAVGVQKDARTGNRP